MEWFRLSDGANPTTVEFTDPASQLKWERFITKYREASGQGSSNQPPNAEDITVWIYQKEKELRTQREKLD
jgi:hypothetical protein